MKRGFIQWDREILPPSVFETRLAQARQALADRDLPALVVYSDVWRSNQARYLTNFMPYWNRSLAVVPRDGPPVLLCALSPRVYPWIRSVTIFEEIRPAPKLAEAVTTLCAERGWTNIGMLDLPQVIHEVVAPLRRAGLELIDVPSIPQVDDAELAMRRRAATRAREVLAAHLPSGAGRLDRHFAGTLEREFRRAGAEDLVILLSTGEMVPAPARGALLPAEYSVAVALEYCGHWVKVTRARTAAQPLLDHSFDAALRSGLGRVEDLSGSYPYQMGRGPIFALHVEATHAGRRLFHGDTCHQGRPL